MYVIYINKREIKEGRIELAFYLPWMIYLYKCFSVLLLYLFTFVYIFVKLYFVSLFLSPILIWIVLNLCDCVFLCHCAKETANMYVFRLEITIFVCCVYICFHDYCYHYYRFRRCRRRLHRVWQFYDESYRHLKEFIYIETEALFYALFPAHINYLHLVFVILLSLSLLHCFVCEWVCVSVFIII